MTTGAVRVRLPEPVAIERVETRPVGIPQLPPRRRWRPLVAGAVLAVLALAVVAAWLAGLRCFVVESPSMGTTAPVGTLVIGMTDSAPVVGDLITFHPPGVGYEPYTHRIVARTSAGFRTRGDINGADDPWVVTRSMVESRAVAEVPAAGWLLKAAPIMLGGLVLAQVAGLVLRAPATRWSLRLLGVIGGLAAVCWLYRPFSGWTLLQSVAKPDGMHATVVSTAILPIRLSAIGGGHIDLAAGEVGRLVLPRSAGGHVGMTSALALDPPGWALLVLVCLLPVLFVLAVGVPVEEGEGGARA